MNEMDLGRFFFALIFLLGSAHSVGFLFHRFRMPKMIGEILGGVLCGPAAMGWLFPQIQHRIFSGFASEPQLLNVFYQLGLVLLMFISGFELNRSTEKKDVSLIASLLAGSTLLPFLGGWLGAQWFPLETYMGPAQNRLAFMLVVSCAAAVTSIPVISRIFLDLDLMSSRFAKIILSSSTIHDIILWVVLTIATGLVSGGRSAEDIALVVLLTLVFFVIALKAMPRLFVFVNSLRANLLLKASPQGYILLICLLFAALASLLKINIVFGAFLAGITVGMMDDEKFGRAREDLRSISLGFFVPLYFSLIGLRLNLVASFDLPLLLGFLLFTSAIQIAGSSLSVKWSQRKWVHALNFGIAMNTRGGPGIVLATVAYDHLIINEAMLVALILTAILTSLFTGYWLRRNLERGQSLMGENN